jgi:hypothetical protein
MKEKVGKNKNLLEVSYEYRYGVVISVEFKTDNYSVIIRKNMDSVMLIERLLEEGKFKTVNTKILEDAEFHERTLRKLERFVERLSNRYSCIYKYESPVYPFSSKTEIYRFKLS